MKSYKFIHIKTLNSRPTGLTLIEILIVITIIGILASVIVPNLMKKPDQARVVAAKQAISSLVQALQIYKLDNYDYPSAQQGLEALVTKPNQSSENPYWSGPYVDRIPLDPWGNEYVYEYPREDEAPGFRLFSKGPDGKTGEDKWILDDLE